MKNALLKTVAAMGLLIGGSSAFGATITLTPTYLGYSNQTVAAFGASAPTGLNTGNITTGYGDLTNRYYFAVNMNFSASSDTTLPEDFRSILYNITLPVDSGATPLGAIAGTPLGVMTSRTGGAAAYTANTTDLSSSVGTSAATGFSNVFPNQTTGATAFDNATGQSSAYTVGYFIVKLNDTKDGNRTVTLAETGTSTANNFTYFTNNSDSSDDSNFVTVRNTFVGNSFTFPQAPEPASIGLLGMGAVGLIRRRRQA